MSSRFVCEARKFPAHLLSVMAPRSTQGKGNGKNMGIYRNDYMFFLVSLDVKKITTLSFPNMALSLL